MFPPMTMMEMEMEVMEPEEQLINPLARPPLVYTLSSQVYIWFRP